MKYVLLLFACCTLFTIKSNAQADTLVNVCSKHLKLPFISDGQQYQALINGDETAEFHATFYGGSTYRIIGCSGLNDGNLQFTITDPDHNKIFANTDFSNAPYWDFKFTNTMDCIIEAKLASKKAQSGFAIIMIGFKK